MRTFFLFIVVFITLTNSFAQSINSGSKEDESDLYSSTKQVNQFINRFNGEEDLYGKRLYPKDKKYRDATLRKKYLTDLFDSENPNLKPQKDEFIQYVNANKPQFFDFYGDKWFAEVSSDFLYNGKEQNVILYFKLEKENDGYKWSFSNAYAGFFAQEFKSEPLKDIEFIHPMSHEIDFMSLDKVFKYKSKQIEHFATKEYTPDYLTLFFREVKKGTLVFQSVTDVKFHVFQIENWYFELQYFNRKGDNTGWLISNLIKIPEKEKASLIKSINHEN